MFVCDCMCVRMRVSECVCVCARERWRSPFPPWVVTPHGPAWKPALSRAAPAHLASPPPSLPLRWLFRCSQLERAGLGSQAPGVQLHPPTGLAVQPWAVSRSLWASVFLEGGALPALPSILRDLGRAEGSEGAAGPSGCGSWPWKGFLANEDSTSPSC